MFLLFNIVVTLDFKQSAAIVGDIQIRNVLRTGTTHANINNLKTRLLGKTEFTLKARRTSDLSAAIVGDSKICKYGQSPH